MGNYIVGVSAKGNNSYNPNVEDSGLGGKSEGRYQLRIDFHPPEQAFMVDDSSDGNGTAVQVDGDADGRPGGAYDFWFIPTGPTNMVLVDKASRSTATPDGSRTLPFKNIAPALESVRQKATSDPNNSYVLRIVGNGGADNQLSTTSDNLAYEIGFNRLGQAKPTEQPLMYPKMSP